MKSSNIPENLSNEQKKGTAIKKVLTVTQIIALAWSALVVIIYISLTLNLFGLLPEFIMDICTVILYFGIWGAPIFSVLTLPLYIIYIFRVNGKVIGNDKKRFFVALLIPIIITLILAFYELNFGEYLS